MKLFISADIEGTTGIALWDETENGHSRYPYFAEQMTKEVKAACEGAMAAGADDILIKKCECTLVGSGGQSDNKGVKIFEHLFPHVIYRTMALVHNNAVENLRGIICVVNYLFRLFLVKRIVLVE